MTLEEVLDQAILAYLSGEEPLEINKNSDEPFKYTKSYFDDADTRLLPEEEKVPQDPKLEKSI